MIGLALSGGGTRGSYEIGSYMAFKKCHIKFDMVSGTSIGAFNAAMIASGKEKELQKFWNEAKTGEILGFDKDYIDKVNLNKKDLEYYKATINSLKKILKDKGISVSGMQKVLNDFNLEPILRKKKIIFGLTTFRLDDFKPLDLFIDDMKEFSVNDYILASCYLPVFKKEKLVDGQNFFDGGLYNNCPVNMLLKKGCKRIYAINLRAIGINEKVDKKSLSKITYISPSRKICSILSVNKEEIRYAMNLGYYDTLKVVKNYDGKKYIFKKIPNFMYYFMAKKIKKNFLDKMFNKDDKSIVIDYIEKKMLLNEYTYFKVYSPYKVFRAFK